MTQQVDFEAVRIDAAYEGLAQTVKEMAHKAAGLSGMLAKERAEKALLIEEVKRLKAQVEEMVKAGAEAKTARAVERKAVPEKAKA